MMICDVVSIYDDLWHSIHVWWSMMWYPYMMIYDVVSMYDDLGCDIHVWWSMMWYPCMMIYNVVSMHDDHVIRCRSVGLQRWSGSRLQVCQVAHQGKGLDWLVYVASNNQPIPCDFCVYLVLVLIHPVLLIVWPLRCHCMINEIIITLLFYFFVCWVGELLIDFLLDVAFLPSWASFSTTFHANCCRGESLWTTTCLKTEVGVKQWHVPCKIHVLELRLGLSKGMFHVKYMS